MLTSDDVACHCRRVLHPLLGRSIGCISIHSTCFLPCLDKVIPRRGRLLDSERQAVFIHPRWEPELLEVASAHFGMGVFWDETILTDLGGWKTEEARPRRPRTVRAVDLAAALRTLGAEPNATLWAARRAYRRASMRLHPDHGGSNAAMAELNAAWELVRKMG